MLAKEIMTRDVIMINAGARIYELTKLLAEKRISGVPVCDDKGQVVGVVTQADLLALKEGERVRDIMSREVIKVSSDTRVEDVARILSQNKIKRVPVFEDGRLVGIISRTDIIAAIAKSEFCQL